MKKLYLLFLIFIIFTLTSCDTVINGHRCIAYESIFAENEYYIVFPEVVYNKNNKEFYPTKTLDDKFFNAGEIIEIELMDDSFDIYATTKISTFSYDGKMISEEEISTVSLGEYKFSLIDEGFYSSFQRINPEQEELTDIEEKIWEYAKTKSLKNEFPYCIEGNCKRKEDYIYFNVNVYDKIMWKGGALVNQGAKSTTLNRISENTKEIEEILSFDDSAIKCFNENYVFLYNKKNNSLDYYNLNTEEQKTISKSDDWYFFYLTDKYVLRINGKNIPYDYEIYLLS